MIPKTIYTFWAGEMDPLTKRCIESQKLPGYEHVILTPENIHKGSRYLNEAMAAEKLGVKRWCKVADFARLFYVWAFGGIYLDADMEVLPGKNFDHLLGSKLFVSEDEEGNYSSAAMGGEAGQPILKHIMDQVEDNYRGDGGWVWETGFLYFTNTMKAHKAWDPTSMDVVPSDRFFPYHWRNKEHNFTENTLVKHHYVGSWTK